MTAAGICMGASNIKIVEFEDRDGEKKITNRPVRSHEGDVKESLLELIKENNLSDKKLAVTGRKFKSLVEAPSLSEPEATELAYEHVRDKYEDVEAIISAGGETFMVYELNKDGKMINVYTGSKCASGTGEFFLQQVKRMGLDLDKATDIARIENPYRVSGRCSVFCKSDCTHALNKGKDKGRIVAGLCQMMVDKIMELVHKSRSRSVMLVGGMARNNVVVNYLRERMDRVVVPKEAFYFEAIGTAIWAEDNGEKISSPENIFVEGRDSFDYMPPLKESADDVIFHSIDRDEARDGDECILGLDVGSTTTKAVIIRKEDDKLLASEYLRTSGDPVNAARECYKSLDAQIGDSDIDITGLGVTGSGRRITGLHALTESVINEIIAHAAGAVHFDEGVDTIFEIGGQDAKYTYLVNGVPTNYAMNEACSAGTGSFLEESAEESLDIAMEDIADIALKGDNPPNFNDQCSAFIGSDIKNAIQEGIEIEDICAGLVYSICQNYTNRVKGNRPVGDKVFMQGGVCYNQAVPMAMAALTGKEIIVPPEPGLMGAFGVALETKRQLELELVEEKDFNLEELYQRDVEQLDTFICQGGSSGCDRKCSINVLEVAGERHLFGGICNKYMTLDDETDHDINNLNLVKKREKLLFDDFLAQPGDEDVEEVSRTRGKIGLNRSLTIHSLLPFYSRFFAELGYEVVLPEEPEEEGIQQQSAAFCYPVEVSHGYMHNLLDNRDWDYIFLPHVKGLHVKKGPEDSILCPMAQGEPYYLSATWPELEDDNVLSPVLDFKDGFEEVKDEFIQMGKRLKANPEQIEKAFERGLEAQQQFKNKLKDMGKSVLDHLDKNPEQKASIIFGRPYNAFASETNMGIPHKFASQGELVLPFDMLPIEDEEIFDKMYWSMGQLIMKGTRFVSRHPQLFGTYITNFSCGPDSFLVNYFRQENGTKPSLTLELDSHTADVGVNTRIEAFLDVVDRYRNLEDKDKGDRSEGVEGFSAAQASLSSGNIEVRTSSGEILPISHDRVKLMIPSMGGLATRAVASAMQYKGIDAVACKSPGEDELKRGKAHATGKECLPFLLTLGTMLNYADKKENDDVMVYFMAESSGPCRLGQYTVMMEKVIRDKQLEDVALLSLDCGPGYRALGHKFLMRAWQALAVADVMEDVYSTIAALARDPERGKKLFNKSRDNIFQALSSRSWWGLKRVLKKEAKRLKQIELVKAYENARKVALTGEMYVRNDEFSRRYLVDKLAERGIVTTVAPIIEWLYYVDHMNQHTENYEENSFFDKIKDKMSNFYKRKIENDVRSIFATSDLCSEHPVEIGEIVEAGEGVMSKKLTGETILTIGGAIAELIDSVEGIIAIGPFGCMHHRVSESIVKDRLEEQKYQLTEPGSVARDVLNKFSSLPFLAIESDGNAFPQVIEARLEAFCLQVRRINEFINEKKSSV